jgi:hypothetical protein
MAVTRRGLLWTMGALLGIALTAVLTWSVSQLAGQRIGQSSEPLSVVRPLAPRLATRARPARHRPVPSHSQTITLPGTTTAVVVPSIAPTVAPTPAPAAATTPAQTPAQTVAAPVQPAAAPPGAGSDRHDDSGGAGAKRRDD